MKNIRKILLYLFGFVLLYFPCVLPSVNPYIFPILFFLMFVILEIPFRKITAVEILKKKNIFLFTIGVIFSALYFALFALLKNSATSLSDTRIVQGSMFVLYMFLVVYLIKYLYKIGNDFNANLKFLFKVANIQGIICLAMLLVPSLKSVANALFTATTSYSSDAYILTTRVYGISNSYTFGLPIFHGILSGICYYLAIAKDKSYFKYLPLTLLVSVLNGRTGLIVATLLIVFSTLYVLVKKRGLKPIFYLILILLFGGIVLYFIKLYVPNMYKFISVIIKEINNYFTTGEFEGTSKYLFNDKLFFPEGLGLIFGEGIRPYTSSNTLIKSDIGFVNDLFMGGLIYVYFLYGAYIRLLVRKGANEKDNFIVFMILIGMVIGNWKGEIFKNSLLMIGILFISLNYLLNFNKLGEGDKNV